MNVCGTFSGLNEEEHLKSTRGQGLYNSILVEALGIEQSTQIPCERGCAPYDTFCEWKVEGKCVKGQVDLPKSLSDVASIKGVSVSVARKEIARVDKKIQVYGNFHKALEATHSIPNYTIKEQTGVNLEGLLSVLAPHVKLYFKNKELNLLPRLFLLPEKAKTWESLGITKESYLIFKSKLKQKGT